MKTLIIGSNEIGKNNDSKRSYELKQLSDRARNHFDKVSLIHPNSAEFIVRPEQRNVEIFHKNTSISHASALIVRTTSGCEEATRMLALSLYSQGCELLDPVERFNGSVAGKSIMSLKGMRDNSLPATYLAYNYENALHLLESLIPEKQFPLVGKPTNGGRGTDVELLPNMEKAKLYLKLFFQKYKSGSTGILFQQYIDILKEYRVMLLDGEILGMVEKKESENSFTRNASKGSEFVSADNETVGDYVLSNASNKGLIGVDAAIDRNGKIYIIESNRSPQWQEFERATGIDIAEKIFTCLNKKMEVSSELF